MSEFRIVIGLRISRPRGWPVIAHLTGVEVVKSNGGWWKVTAGLFGLQKEWHSPTAKGMVALTMRIVIALERLVCGTSTQDHGQPSI